MHVRTGAHNNDVNQKLAVTLLSKWGHRIDVVSNGVQAVERSRQHTYDVILMDLQMPEMGGFEATRLIRGREQGLHTPIVAMTANAMSKDHQRCLDAGMDDYISMPLDTERLRAVLEVIIPASPETGSLPANLEPDFDYTQALVTADAWVIETIGQAFLDDCPRQMKEIEDAIQFGEHATLIRSAHTLRGLVGNFNARRIEDLARELEHQDTGSDMFKAGIVYSKLVAEIGAMNAALKNLLEQSASA